jgi:hypothetical protein
LLQKIFWQNEHSPTTGAGLALQPVAAHRGFDGLPVAIEVID